MSLSLLVLPLSVSLLVTWSQVPWSALDGLVRHDRGSGESGEVAEAALLSLSARLRTTSALPHAVPPLPALQWQDARWQEFMRFPLKRPRLHYRLLTLCPAAY